MKITGSEINKLLGLKAMHALYSFDGTWYHHLTNFPGILFDMNGMIWFNTEEEYKSNKFLHHRQHLNIPDGISVMPGYRSFTKTEREIIGLSENQGPIINPDEAWSIFIEAAIKYESEEEVYFSPTENKRYQIVSTEGNTVRIQRLDASNSSETIGWEKFKTCIARINKKVFPINKGAIYEHVAEEVTLVELLPMLDWNEEGNKILYTGNIYYLEDEFIHKNELPEAKNDNIGLRKLTSLKVRRGQKKLRDKLFQLYNGKCVISKCEIKEVLHACHISPFAISGNNISTNAILLRSDLHDLFDASLLAINPETYKINIHKSLSKTIYADYDGLLILERGDTKEINKEGLEERWVLFNTIII